MARPLSYRESSDSSDKAWVLGCASRPLGRAGVGVEVQPPGGLGVFIAVRSDGAVSLYRSGVRSITCSSSDDDGGPGSSGSPFGGDGVWNSTLEVLKEDLLGGVDNTELAGSAFEWEDDKSDGGDGGGDNSWTTAGGEANAFWSLASSLSADDGLNVMSGDEDREAGA